MLEAINITKRYDRSVLDSLSFAVQPGEIVGVVGKSGSGKSTLLRLLNLIETPDSGELLFDGKRIDPLNKKQLLHAQQEIGMIFQHYNLIGRTNVLKNVLHGRLGKIPFRKTAFGLYPEKDKQEAVQLLEKVGLQEQMYQRANALSGGQMQRVGICRAIMQQPKLILADEPIASLDPNAAKVVMKQLQEITQERQITCIVNLHQVDFAKAYATRIIGVKEGKIVFDGKPQELTEAMIAHIYQGKEEQQRLTQATIPVGKEQLTYGEA